jgi:methionine aminopeptidase
MVLEWQCADQCGFLSAVLLVLLCCCTAVLLYCSMSVVKTYCGHGIGDLFHCAPNIPHYAHNKAVGVMKEGQVSLDTSCVVLTCHADLV